jgi:hypothetical protein
MLKFLIAIITSAHAFISPMKYSGGRELFTSTSPMVYHGGPVLDTNASAPLKMHFLLYGNWQNAGLIFDFVQAIGGSKYFNILTSYTGIKNVRVDIGTVQKLRPATTSLSDSDIPRILHSLFQLPASNQEVFVVLTSPEISVSNGGSILCRDFCGYHNNDSSFLYILVGDSSKCPSSCQIENTGPNYAAGASSGIDGILNILAHEIAEVITDPKFNAWTDKFGLEIGDKCQWKFGYTRYANNGAKCNLDLVIGNETKCFMIQELFLNKPIGKCVMGY